MGLGICWLSWDVSDFGHRFLTAAFCFLHTSWQKIQGYPSKGSPPDKAWLRACCPPWNPIFLNQIASIYICVCVFIYFLLFMYIYISIYLSIYLSICVCKLMGALQISITQGYHLTLKKGLPFWPPTKSEAKLSPPENCSGMEHLWTPAFAAGSLQPISGVDHFEPASKPFQTPIHLKALFRLTADHVSRVRNRFSKLHTTFGWILLIHVWDHPFLCC